MNPEPTANDPLAQAADEELSSTLSLFYRLSNEAIVQINELTKNLHVRFAEAALHSGAITQKELDQALEWMHQRAADSPRGVVPHRLRRAAEKRDLVLWAPDPLTPSARISLIHRPEHPRSETIRSLRTALLLRCKHRRGAKMIALLSPGAGEGRSQLAAELAVAFAQLNRRTLLVDADLRKPDQHRLFGADNATGLSQALATDGTQHLHGIQGLPRMALMTAGEPTPNPLELLSGRAFERLMIGWRKFFDFVILDTPPTAHFSDGLAVAATAGNVLMLGRAPATRFSELNEICRNLSSTRSRILGAVISTF